MAEQTEPRLVMMRKGRLEDLDRTFDLAFWQAQDDTARFAASWELVVHAEDFKGKDRRQLRLQRSIEAFHRLPGYRRLCRPQFARPMNFPEAKMHHDPITEEIRDIRRALTREFDNDLERIITDSRRRENESGRVFARLPKRPVRPTRQADQSFGGAGALAGKRDQLDARSVLHKN